VAGDVIFLDSHAPAGADRVIVASALAKGVPILSKDTTIREFEGVPSVW
jgi:PIN domain nuclease of toxin-antitoxin system